MADFIAALLKNNHLCVKVKPNARNTQVLKIEQDVVYLSLAVPAEDGKANKELERYLTRIVGKSIGKKAVIKSGFSSREKLVAFV